MPEASDWSSCHRLELGHLPTPKLITSKGTRDTMIGSDQLEFTLELGIYISRYLYQSGFDLEALEPPFRGSM